MTITPAARPSAIALVGTCVCAAVLVLARHPATTSTPAASSRPPVLAAPGQPETVVVELFTSEGCSSCPPADQVLTELAERQVGDTAVLALGEHVDYWDRLGWRDPFSSAAFSGRQSEYDSRVFHAGTVYTPQIVVDGQYQAVGSDIGAVDQAIASASHVVKAEIEMIAWLERPDEVRVHLRAQLPHDLSLGGDADLLVALTENHLADDVDRGENRGLTLTHSAVVRSLTSAGSFAASTRELDATATASIGSAWKLDDISIVGLLQERQSRRIVGAGSTRISRGDRTRPVQG